MSMKPYGDYKAEQATTREPLPAGGYVAKIIGAKVATYKGKDGTSYDKLEIGFDIVEGQYKGHFQDDFAANSNPDKKWRGVFRLPVPKDDGTEKDGWSKRSFGNAMWAVEASNTGYSWDWNEAGLKNKLVGVLFRDKEWAWESKTGWTTECCAFDSVESIKGGKFKQPKPKALTEEKASGAAAAFTTLTEEEDDGDKLPF